MTHLRIELNNGIIEEVSSAVIDKLYDIVHSGTLDNTSNLIGRLHTSATYQDYIDYLEDAFKVNGVKQLIIDATKAYLMFEDPEVLRIVLSHNVGDGTGVSASDLVSVTNVDTWFRNNTTITSLNDLLKFTNVTSITNIATNDTNLISVTLREGLLEIKDLCFYNCTSLLTINFPSTLTKINDNRQYNDYGAFQNCTSLTTITGGENITVLGPAFTNCSSLLSLEDIDLSNLIHLGKACFANCENLELGSVTLSNSITTMGDTVFKGCKKLTSISIPGVTTITPGDSFAQGSFYDCDHLTTVIGSNIAYVGQMSFRYCSALSSIDLSNCTYIGICAFLECTSLTSIDLSSCTTIGTSAFHGCTSLTSVDLSSCTSIGQQAFTGCTSLTSIDLSNVTSIPIGCFKNCTSLTSIDLSDITLIGPLAPNNDNYDKGAFLGCTSLTTVIGLSDIDYIGGWSFTNCTSLGTNQDLVINTTQTFIGSAAFYKTKYRSVVVNGPNVDHLTNGYYKPFQNMPNCTYFDISNTVVTIGNGDVIPNRSNLETIILPSTISSLGYSIWDFGNNTIIKYFIILATTPPSYENITYCKLGTNGNFYVPDNAVAAYKSTWPEIGWSSWNIHDHIKPLSELPVGVWKTGLYQLYEPYLSNSSDPTYSTT